MLINEIRKVNINKKNIEWYQSKGYECKLSSKIEVYTRDMIPATHTKIRYECDLCGCIREIGFSDFVRHRGLDDKSYCFTCANKLRSEAQGKEFMAYDGLKKCNLCQRILPADTDHFYLKPDTKDGFCNRCIECLGRKFRNKLTHIPKDGCKFCIKCDRELPNNYLYFPIDKTCKSGLRNVCRECMNGHFMSDDYTPIQKWNDEENQLFIERYPHYTNDELIIDFYPDLSLKQINDRAYHLRTRQNINLYKTTETLLRYRSQHGDLISGEYAPNYSIPMFYDARIKLSKSLQEYYKTHDGTRKGVKCTDEERKIYSEIVRARKQWVGNKNPRHINPLSGSENGNWKGGLKPLSSYLRDYIREWKEMSMQICDYKCVVTGGDFNNIHHLYNFSKIVNEAFSELNFTEFKQIGEYSYDDLNKIVNMVNVLHNKYGLGLCLNKTIHKLYHDNFGYSDNNNQQFIEFIHNLENGVYDEFLYNNNIKLCINHDVINKLLYDQKE